MGWIITFGGHHAFKFGTIYSFGGHIGCNYSHTSLNRSSSVTAMLEDLEWEPLEQRKSDACLYMFYKIVNLRAIWEGGVTQGTQYPISKLFYPQSPISHCCKVQPRLCVLPISLELCGVQVCMTYSFKGLSSDCVMRSNSDMFKSATSLALIFFIFLQCKIVFLIKLFLFTF